MAELLILWENAGLRALIDITIMSAAVFLLIRTFRVSGAGRIAMGIAIAAAIFVMANVLELRGIMWVYSRLSPVLLIVTVVIFQPELRRILEHGASFRRARRELSSTRLPTVVVEALELLSQRRWGALLVFPGTQPLERWLTGGVHLGAESSVALLLSLFDPHSPGHDGAVVFDGERIGRFAVRLPLSQSDRLDPRLGTRHNAALGLAESTDALVLTVSEERGSISAFENGAMTPLTTAAGAVQYVKRYGSEARRPGQSTDLKRRGYRYSLQVGASVAAAIILWAGVTLPSGQVVERSLDVPVEYTTSANHTLVGSTQTSVTLHVAGDELTVRELDGAQAYVRINLSAASPGSQTVVISDDDVRLPRKVELLDVTPMSFDVTLRAITEGDMSIAPQLIGSVPTGFRLTGVTLTPTTVRAITPVDFRSSEERGVTTTPIYLDGLTSDALLYAKIVAPPSIRPVDRRWPDVEVRIGIERTGP